MDWCKFELVQNHHGLFISITYLKMTSLPVLKYVDRAHYKCANSLKDAQYQKCTSIAFDWERCVNLTDRTCISQSFIWCNVQLALCASRWFRKFWFVLIRYPYSFKASSHNRVWQSIESQLSASHSPKQPVILVWILYNLYIDENIER